MTDLGLLKQFLGLEIVKYEEGIKVIQQKYTVKLLIKFKMAECKESKCLFLSGIKLGEVGDSPLVDISLYRQLVRSLLYLTYSSPDLAYVVGVVSIYMHQSHEICCKESKSILQYVQGTRNFGVHYGASSQLELVGFTDSDWVGDPIDKNSTLDCVFMLAHGPICCSSNKKYTISLSSIEAECRGA